MQSLFDRLAVELLAAIRSYIPDDDLRTHVCFCRAYPGMMAIYDSLYEGQFWKKSCRLVGLSTLPEDRDDAGQVSWKEIAFDTIDRDGFCEHPQCGEHQLRLNGMSIKIMILA